MRDLTLGFALCGSFCTFEKAFEQMRRTAAAGYQLLPIMSNNAYETDTRFGRAADFIWEAEDICGRKVVHTIPGAEPLGPKRMIDALVIARARETRLPSLQTELRIPRSRWRQNLACALGFLWYSASPQMMLWLPRRKISVG